jgi:hypoxanthine phosphoribosyltransferase
MSHENNRKRRFKVVDDVRRTGKSVTLAKAFLLDSNEDSGKTQIVGVAGGSIRPTEISVQFFRDALDFRKNHQGSREKLTCMSISENKYNSAWKLAVLRAASAERTKEENMRKYAKR